MLPGKNGVAICRELRNTDITTPILMLTARDSLEDKLQGFSVGVDDYLVKPFALPELVARLKVLSQRVNRVTAQLKIADLTMEVDLRIVKRAGQPIELNKVCWKIFEALMRTYPKVVSKQYIEQLIWPEQLPESDVLKLHIYKLRQQVDKAFSFSSNGDGWLIKLFRPPKMTFLVTHPLRNSEQILYVVYRDRGPKGRPMKGAENTLSARDIAPPPRPDRPKNTPLITLPNSIIFIVILAILLGYWIVRSLISSVLTPLNELAVMAKSLDENNSKLTFSVMQDKTEIGAVAKILHQTITRIYQSHQREKRFLQNASHELRTPIAVVASALDILTLRASNGNPKVADQHINIRRANNNMTEMTNALLLLSRKNVSGTDLDKVNLKLLSQELIEQHQYLLQGKQVSVALKVEQQEALNISAALCRIVLSNLIRNAFEHTLSGTVSIVISRVCVLITNVCLNTDKQNAAQKKISTEHGFGIGLDIVQQIVKQQNWQFQFSFDFKQGRQVWVCFDKNIGGDFKPLRSMDS